MLFGQNGCGIKDVLKVQPCEPVLSGTNVGMSDGIPEQHNPKQERRVGDAVDQEGLGRGTGGGRFAEPISDQQIAAGTHTFPKRVHHQQVVRQNQHRHREDESAKDGKVPGIARVVMHVALRIDRDHRRDRCNDRKQCQAKCIDP